VKSTNDIVTPNCDCRLALDCSGHHEQVIMSKTAFEMAKTQRFANSCYCLHKHCRGSGCHFRAARSAFAFDKVMTITYSHFDVVERDSTIEGLSCKRTFVV